MRFSIKNFSSIVLAISMSQPSYATDICSQENYWEQNSHEVGFFLSGKTLNILRTNRPLERNKNVSQAEAEKRILSGIKRARKKTDAIAIEDTRLAKLIATAAYTIGVDFQKLTGIVHKETTFCQKRKNTSGSGASGCTQFTTAALKELKDQFGFKGTTTHTRSPQAEAILKGLVTKYFAAQPAPEREKNFYAWLGSSPAQMQSALRGTGNFDIDILAGALLLKIYLSLKGGSYYNALVQYNGDNTRVKIGKKKTTAYKFKYAGDIDAYSSTVSMDNSKCIEAHTQTENMLESTCEFFGEDPYSCISDEELPPLVNLQST